MDGRYDSDWLSTINNRWLIIIEYLPYMMREGDGEHEKGSLPSLSETASMDCCYRCGKKRGLFSWWISMRITPIATKQII